MNENKENKTAVNNVNTKEPKKKNPESSFKRKLKYGSAAMIFTVIFVAAIFVLNVVTTTINNIKPMFIDMTKEQIYGITDASRELLKDVTAPIEITFFMPIDKYEKTVGGGKMIVNCVKTFANEYKNIKITEIDIIKNPGIQNEFKASEVSQLSTSSIAVRSQGKPRLLSNSAFFTTAQSTGELFAFNGERTLTSAILQAVSVDSPLVCFTTGHSENQSPELAKLFDDNGFTVKTVDLSNSELDPATKILVICEPIKDFIGADPNNPTARSEIDKVASFLNKYGSVMYFSSPSESALPELDGLLKEYGMAFEQDNLVIDQKNSLNSNVYNLSADYFVANNVGDELTASIRKLPSPPKTIVPYAKPIKILDTANPNDVSPVLTSSATSYRGNIYDNTVSAPGPSNLLVVAQRTYYENNNPKTALFLVCGSTQFLTYLQNTSYSNADILLNAMRIMTSKKIAVDIEFKLFDSNALTMTIEEQNTWTLITILLLPTLVSITGVVVWLRRRHS